MDLMEKQFLWHNLCIYKLDLGVLFCYNRYTSLTMVLPRNTEIFRHISIYRTGINLLCSSKISYGLLFLEIKVEYYLLRWFDNWSIHHNVLVMMIAWEAESWIFFQLFPWRLQFLTFWSNDDLNFCSNLVMSFPVFLIFALKISFA